MTTAVAPKITNAMDAIINSDDGYILRSDNLFIRTMCHGFLFHFEHYVKGMMRIVSGREYCKHGNDCPYKLAFIILKMLMEDPETLEEYVSYKHSYGCSFAHDDQDFSFLIPLVRHYGTTNFMEKLEEVYDFSIDTNRKWRNFWVLRGNNIGTDNIEEARLYLFSDKIFYTKEEEHHDTQYEASRFPALPIATADNDIPSRSDVPPRNSPIEPSLNRDELFNKLKELLG